MTDPQSGSDTDGGRPHPAAPPASLTVDPQQVDDGSTVDGGRPHPADEPAT
jgi:hypothetical protein